MLQGGPHEHQIAGLACQLREVASPEFKAYIVQTRANAKQLGETLVAKGHALATGGTDNHLLLWDLRPKGVTGSKMEKILDYCGMTVNKNAIYGDKSALSPGGVRLGASALTTRRMVESDMKLVAGFLDRACTIALAIQEKVGKKLADFDVACKENDDVKVLAKDVSDMAKTYYMPGWDVETEMKYRD